MKDIPEMISTKDSAYIKDMFNWNYVAYKKFDSYLESIQDEEIAKLVENLADMHFNNCNTILNLLESGGLNE